jgi:methanogenic corrinoid protein MtbC1
MANARIDQGRLDELVDRLDRLDRDGALAVVARAVAAGAGTEVVIDELLAPAQVDMGRRWAKGQIGAAEVRASAAIVRSALARVAPAAVPTERRPVAVACPEGEQHELPAEMVTELLRAAGWPVTLIAGGVPASELHPYFGEHRPLALLLSCTTASGLPGAARAIEVAQDNGVAVIAGGRAFGSDDRRAMRLGATAWASSVPAAIEVLGQWADTAPRMSLGRALSVEYQKFETALPRIRAAAIGSLFRSSLRRSDDFAAAALVRDRLDLLLAHLGAAVLLDDGHLFFDHLTRQLAGSADRDVEGRRLILAIDAIRQALPNELGPPSGFLEAGDRQLHEGAPPIPDAPLVVATSESAPFGMGSLAGPDVSHGQVFADLLFLAAMACHAPLAVISLAQGDGHWSTLSYGVEHREALDDAAVFAAVAASSTPLEIHDLAADDQLGTGPLATGPLAIRSVYGVPLVNRKGATIGVFCILDRRVREIDRRERRAMLGAARQVSRQLGLWRPTRETAPALAEPRPAKRPLTKRRRGPAGAPAGLRPAGFGADPHLLRSHEVAVLFDVTERTVINWAASAKLASLRTAGGHLRFRSEDVLALMAGRSVSTRRRRP